MSPTIDDIRAILEAARDAGRDALLETEGIALLQAFGFRVPAHTFVSGSQAVAAEVLGGFAGEQVVVKVNSPEILHKSDVGGVRVAANRADAVARVIADMERRFSGRSVPGYSIHEFVPYERGLGRELLLGLRWTDEFGPVIVFGAGGIYTEALSGSLRPGRDVAVLSAVLPVEDAASAVMRTAVGELVFGGLRGQEPLVSVETIEEAVQRLVFVSKSLTGVRDFEVNPLVVHDGELWALDVLVKITEAPASAPMPRPLHKMKNLLEPHSVAVAGVSSGANPGRVILQNLIRDGFDRARIHVVKPGGDEIDGCKCYPDIASLPERVDVLVLSIDASQAAAAVAETIDREAAESIIVIPGGFEEKSGSRSIVRRMKEALAASRASDWGGPLINGGNCLGIQSRPGRYDTLFIPEHKIGVVDKHGAPIAFISQSGAFAVSKNSKLAAVDRKYTITLGNQMDVTIGDYLHYLKDDDEVAVYAVYAEGFKPLDGLRFLDAAREIVASGRSVVLYRAGRTAAGAQASASHTASIAGDYAVTRGLARAAGVLVADTIADFEDLVMLSSWLRGKTTGRRLGAISNAGFECVAIADNLGDFELAELSEPTRATLGEVLESARIGGVVDVHNPVDLTPMMPEGGYEKAIRAVLEDDNVEVGVVACVPLTPALNSLAPGDGHREDVRRTDSIASIMGRLIGESPKACVAVVDGGAIYDEMAAVLTRRGVPTFRTADRALRLLNTVVRNLPPV